MELTPLQQEILKIREHHRCASKRLFHTLTASFSAIFLICFVVTLVLGPDLFRIHVNHAKYFRYVHYGVITLNASIFLSTILSTGIDMIRKAKAPQAKEKPVKLIKKKVSFTPEEYNKFMRQKSKEQMDKEGEQIL